MTAMVSSQNNQALSSGLKRDRLAWRQIFIWIIVSVFLISYHLRLIPYIFDNAYIHFRIAQNFALYGAPYFNLGEPVMASSSPAWTLFLTLLIKVLPSGANIIVVIAIANALFTSTGMMLYTGLARQLSPVKLSPIWYVPMAAIYLSITLRASAGQMEVVLALLVLGIAIRLYAVQSQAAFILFAVAVFFRLEFIVFLLVFGAYSVFTHQLRLKSVGYALLGAAPFVIYSFAYFHTLIPNTALAKSIVYSFPAVSVLVESITNIFPLTNSSLSELIYIICVLGSLMIILFRAFIRHQKSVRENPVAWLMLGCSFAIIAAYSIEKVLLFSWYFPLFTVPLYVSLYSLLSYSKVLLTVFIICFAAPCAVMLVSLSQDAFFNMTAYPDFPFIARTRNYVEVGKALYACFPDATLMTSEIGGLGYGFRGEIKDGAGLVSPEALKFQPLSVPDQRANAALVAIPPAFVTEQKPDLLVSLDMFIEYFKRSSEAGHYYRFTLPVFVSDDMRLASPEIINGQHLNIFIRKDSTKVGDPSTCPLIMQASQP